jgi:hypothetical protein
MTDSIREKVVAALAARLADINESNGYSFSPTIYRALREVKDIDLPAVTIWDMSEDTEHRGSAFAQSMTVQIEAFRISQGLNFSIVGNLSIADVKQAVFASDSTMGGVADGINLVSSEITYPEAGTDIIKTLTEIIIMYSEKRGDPFSQSL